MILSSRANRSRIALPFVVAVLAGGRVHAEPLTFLVGNDAACDEATVQAAVNRAAGNPGPDTIRVAMNQTYTAQAIKVGAQDVLIEGGYATCASAETTPNAHTTLSGTGGAADSVLEFTGAGTRGLSNLVITRGDDPTSGGGIQFDGRGDLLLSNVTISFNTAPFGGGINFHGNGGEAFLTMFENVVVQSNTATLSGGGVRLTGNAVLEMLFDDDTIAGNLAQGNGASNEGFGGGLLVVPPARATIASPGFNNFAAIHDNEARIGGGIAVRARASGDGVGTVLLYTRDPQRPVRIARNRARDLGGGIFLSDSGSVDTAFLCAHEFVLEGNTAPAGAAISSRGTGGSSGGLRFNGVGCDVALPPAEDAVSCAAGVDCNVIRDNRSEDSGAQLTAGAVIELGQDLTLLGNRMAFRDNAGGPVMAADRETLISLTQVLFADNVSTGPLITQAESSFLTSLGHATIAGNVVSGSFLTSMDAAQSLRYAVIDQPGLDVFNAQGNSATAEHVLVSSCGLIACGGTVTATATGARFVDEEGGDYRLHASSRAVDAAPPSGAPRDLDGNTRATDLFRVVDRGGFADLGAYERQGTEPLVRNGGFVVDARQWTEVTPGSVSWAAAGIPDQPGSVRIHDDFNPALNEIAGLRQCVPLPGPGPYVVHGPAYGEGVLAIGRDRARIHWRYFETTDIDDCDGTIAPTAEGDVSFPSGDGSTFGFPFGETVIQVSPQAFNERTQVELTLVAVEGSAALNTSTAVRFDDIRLVPVGAIDEIFADGFEGGAP